MKRDSDKRLLLHAGKMRCLNSLRYGARLAFFMVVIPGAVVAQPDSIEPQDSLHYPLRSDEIRVRTPLVPPDAMATQPHDVSGDAVPPATGAGLPPFPLEPPPAPVSAPSVASAPPPVPAPAPAVASAPPPASVPMPATASVPPAAPATALLGAPATENDVQASLISDWQDGQFVRSLQDGNNTINLPIADGKQATSYEPLGIDDSVALALHNNYAGKAADFTAEATYWEKMASYSLYGPTLEVQLNKGRETSSPASYNDANGQRQATDTHPRHDSIYSIRQPIIDMTIVEDILLKKTRETYAEHTLRDTREGLAYDTVNAYLNLLQSSMAMKLAADYREYLNQLEKRMHARVDGGGATPGDLERVRGRMTNAESARIQAEGEYQNSLADFRRLTQVVPSRLAVPDVLAPAIPEQIDEAIIQAEKDSPSYQGMIDKIDMAKKARDHSYAGLLPTLSLQYDHNNTYNAGGAAKGNPVDGVYPTQEDERFMVVAHWTIASAYDALNGVAGSTHVREATYQAMDAKERLAQAVQSSYNAVRAANERIAVIKKGVDANKRVVDEFEDQQQNGRRSLFELLDAYEQLYNSQVNLMHLVVARAQAGYLVHRQMGTLLSALQAASSKASSPQASN